MSQKVQEKTLKLCGYSIGGKTGTSEDGVNTGKYVTSFVGVATIEDPEVAILITLYNPTGEGGHQGGGVAAPIAGQIFNEILPYLEIKNSQDDEVTIISTPNVVGLTIKEAKEILEDFEIQIENEDSVSNDSVITKQIPESGVSLETGGTVILYCK